MCIDFPNEWATKNELRRNDKQFMKNHLRKLKSTIYNLCSIVVLVDWNDEEEEEDNVSVDEIDCWSSLRNSEE